MEYPSVLVIGAGIGGITAAARLARDGCQVTVVEKNAQGGGRCGRMVRDGHHFDTGATLFLMPELYAQAFTDLGERIQDHLDLRRVDPTYHIHFADGSTLALTSDLNAMQVQLESIEPGSFGAYLRYLNEGYIHYKLSMPHLVQRNFYNLAEFCSPKILLLLFKIKALVKHYDHVGRFFSDPRLKAAFTFQNMYIGLSPYEAPALFSILQYTEFADGVWFPMGGMYSLIEVLTTIAEKKGVRFLYNAPVEQINVDDRSATGVTLSDGRRIQADILVTNADLPYVYRNLLPDDGSPARLDKKQYGCSALTFYWGVDRRFKQLGAHNLFLAGDYRQSFEPIFNDFDLPQEPNIYVHAPARLDPSLAPNGQDTLMVAVPVGHINEAAPQDWDVIRERARGCVLQRLAKIGISDLDEHIKFEVSCTPPDWQDRYNLLKGSTHGLSHNLTQLGYLRPRNKHACYTNLYFVGASTHPGTGMPTVLVSARLTTERILRDYSLRQRISVVQPAVSF